MKFLKDIAKFCFVYSGIRNLHETAIQKNLRSFLNQIDLEYFRKEHSCPRMENRDELFTFINEQFGKNSPMTYLEFGVHKGESMNKWLCQNTNSNSRFYGFDSFEGLPETWDKERGKGLFDVGGKLPEINDPRVTFVKGWFNKTVPRFVRDFAPKNRLVVHMDADLYSSTLLALIYLNQFIVPDTILIFDEFYDRDHEFKAFADYIMVFKKKFKVLCEMDNFAKVGIEIC